VAHDKNTLEQFEITHILNLGYGVQNAFEDDYNYKKLDILDTPETDIRKYFDECFEFIDEGRQRGNVLVHCNAGVSRSCAICCAYLMTKEKKTFDEALTIVSDSTFYLILYNF
jgi:protein-tyrosine phosphatase